MDTPAGEIKIHSVSYQLETLADSDPVTPAAKAYGGGG